MSTILDPLTGFPKYKFFMHLKTFIKMYRKKYPTDTISDKRLALIHNEMSNVHFDNQIARAKRDRTNEN